MYYYDPNDKSPRRWAVCAAVLYALALGGAFAFVSFDFRQPDRLDSMIEIEFVEPKPEPPQPPAKPAPEPRVHEAARPPRSRTPRSRGKETRYS